MSHEQIKVLEMLGYNLTGDGTVNAMALREELCGFCGIEHKNPKLLHLYSNCENCKNCLREPAMLRKEFESVPPNLPLEVLIASYGDTIDASKAIDVTEKCNEIISERKNMDRLNFKKTVPLNELFGVDPSPGYPKQIRFRYRMLNKFGFITIPVPANNTLPESFLLLCPTDRVLTILSGRYGHPIGKTKTGRMSYDVSSPINCAEMNL